MNITQIFKNIEVISYTGKEDIVIDRLSQDTREEYSSQTLYFAVSGTQVDGHDYIAQAIEKGATGVVCDHLPQNINENILYILVAKVSECIGYIAANFYRNPTDILKVIGVTGTNGKTTVATNIYQALLRLDKKAALFSTAGDFINDQPFDAYRLAGTSMEIIEFNKNARTAVDAGCEYLCIEATSHALDQGRLNGVTIHGTVFTNLTQDHLNYHGTMQHYAAAKKKLFDRLDKSHFAIVNADDVYGSLMVSETKAKVITYGNAEVLDVNDRDLVFKVQGFSLKGAELSINAESFHVQCLGTFNMYNITASYGVLRELGFSAQAITKALSGIKGARGRMEIVSGKNKPQVIGIVDYAHTPDALQNVLETLQELAHNKIITVVGVGGDRDRTKRSLMARIAQDNSDYVIFTSDNPRMENPQQIFSDLLAGCDSSKENFEKVQDREVAIKKATQRAEAGDIILVAGKGHEDYQIIGTLKNHFDDVEVLSNFL